MLVGDEPLGEGSFGLVWRCQSRTRDGDAAGGSEERAAKRITRGRLAKRDERNLFGDGHSEGDRKADGERVKRARRLRKILLSFQRMFGDMSFDKYS